MPLLEEKGGKCRTTQCELPFSSRGCQMRAWQYLCLHCNSFLSLHCDSLSSLHCQKGWMDALCLCVALTDHFSSRGDSNLIQTFLKNREWAAMLQEWVSDHTCKIIPGRGEKRTKPGIEDADHFAGTKQVPNLKRAYKHSFVYWYLKLLNCS